MINNTLKILTIVILGLITSCKDGPIGSDIVATGFPFEIFSGSGVDLLDPGSDGAITEENTNLYYLINGSLEKQFHSNLDFPKHFCIQKSDFTNTYKINPFLNTATDVSGVSTTILRYSKYPDDTIKAQIFSGNSVGWGNVWINGKQVVDVNWSHDKLAQGVRHVK